MNAITKNEAAYLEPPLITFELNGRDVTGRSTETLIEIANREGVENPQLCYKEGLDTVGNCRSCMVEIRRRDAAQDPMQRVVRAAVNELSG